MPMLKCSSERWVWAPHSLSAGTSTTPRLSLSFLMLVIGSLLGCCSADGACRSAGPMASRRSGFGDVDDGLSKGLRSFLRQVVPDAAIDGPVRVFARELLGVGARVRVGRTIGVAFEGDGRHRDHRALGKPFFLAAVFRLAF